jgi:transmembrane anterior posterior transformation protein 1
MASFKLLDLLRCRRPKLGARTLQDVCLILILIGSVIVLNQIKMSWIYHYVRGQSMLKLYVLFNMLSIVDKMCCSVGEDVLGALHGAIFTTHHLFSTSTSTIFHVCSSFIYVITHSLVLFLMAITLNVCVNSNNNSLFILLVSNNFIELKRTVFKRFRVQNHFQMTCSDVVERFQLMAFIVTIGIQNIAHVGLINSVSWMQKAGMICGFVLGTEILIDWIKHGFVSKFNLVSPQLYTRFSCILCGDITASHGSNTLTVAHSHAVSKRIGFGAVPFAVVFIRVLYQAFKQCPWPSIMLVSAALLFFVFILSLKLCLSIGLLGHAAKVVHERARFEQDHPDYLVDEADSYQVLNNSRPDILKELRDLPNVDRYALYGNRIPD